MLFICLPESYYNMLVTNLEANAEVPKMEVATECLLHKEHRQKDRAEDTNGEKKSVTTERRTGRKGLRCHHCKQIGDMKRDWFELAAKRSSEKEKKTGKHKAAVKQRDSTV